MHEIDQVGMAKPTTKGSWMVTDPRRIPDMISHAIRVAFEGRRGPVHLTIPVDVQQMEIDEKEVNFFERDQYISTQSSTASKEQIAKAIDIMKMAKKPLIIVGSPGAYSKSGDDIRRLVETTKFPIMTEGDARGIIADTHKYSRGFFDSGLNKAARKIRESDLVILLGRKQDLIVGYAMSPIVPANAKLIQVDPDGSVIGRNRGVDVGIVGSCCTIDRGSLKTSMGETGLVRRLIF